MIRRLKALRLKAVGELLGRLDDWLFEIEDFDIEGLDAGIADEMEPDPAFETENLWVLNAAQIRDIFVIARAEPNDDLALLTVQANSGWLIADEDVEEWPPTEEG